MTFILVFVVEHCEPSKLLVARKQRKFSIAADDHNCSPVKDKIDLELKFTNFDSCAAWIFTSSQWRGLRVSSARRVTTTVHVPLPADSVCNWVSWSQMAVACVARTASRRRWFVRRMTIVENMWHLAPLHVTHAPLHLWTAAELQL